MRDFLLDYKNEEFPNLFNQKKKMKDEKFSNNWPKHLYIHQSNQAVYLVITFFKWLASGH